MKTLLAVMVLALAGCVQERTGVSQTEVPGPVMATLEKSARPAKITTIVRERREKELRYIASASHEGKRWEIAADGGGNLLYKKED
jgi:hypothetical protein